MDEIQIEDMGSLDREEGLNMPKINVGCHQVDE